MGSLIKSCITLAIIAGIAYLVFFVSFGDKTLYQHMVGISETKEAKTLGNEVGKKYKKTKKKVTREIKDQIKELTVDEKKSSSKASSTGAQDKNRDDNPTEESAKEGEQAEHSDNDRQALKRLFKNKLRDVANN
jgi:ABC-type sugar transport system substrate-binding protein